MTTAELKTILEAVTGFANKVVYWCWPENQAPALPFICYFTPDSNNFGADNKVYYSANHFIIELYNTKKDEATELLVENKLSENGIFFIKSWSYIEDENCFLTQYEVEV